ncbi:hypothetical protein BVIET440_290010 [Burkholderia vietnamiensis]|nr:hypothetical protein BVI2075_230087 [Burkholderia vietnamiensis]
MQSDFLMRRYETNCTPRPTDDGKFAAQVEVTKMGYGRAAAFRKLGEFDTETEAVEYAQMFSEEWLSCYAWLPCDRKLGHQSVCVSEIDWPTDI